MSIEDMLSSLARLERLGDSAARHAAPFVDEAVKATAKAGTTPDGQPWAPKKDGTRALVHAADALTTTASGNVVRVTLRSPETFHNFSKRHPRQVLPAGITKNVEAALVRAAGAAFDEATR